MWTGLPMAATRDSEMHQIKYKKDCERTKPLVSYSYCIDIINILSNCMWTGLPASGPAIESDQYNMCIDGWHFGQIGQVHTRPKLRCAHFASCHTCAYV